MAQIFTTPIITNDQSIDRVLAVKIPALLIFLKGEVRPDLEQIMQRLARENAGALLVVKVPVADAPTATQKYQLKQFPAIVTVRDGQVLSRAEAISGPDLEKHAAFLLGTGPQPKPAQHARQDGRARRSTGPTHKNGKPVIVTEATFDQEVLRASLPVLVDFWAPWCGPCRMVEPILEKLARELSGRLRVAKVNVDENPAIAQRYGVQSIPTMMVVKDGQIADRWAGALPEATLRSRLASFMGR